MKNNTVGSHKSSKRRKKSNLRYGNWLHVGYSISYPKLVGLGFISVIMLGTILLMLPVSSRNGVPTGLLDAMFTATSATCVTGLIVCDTYIHWSLFGQVVIILLIQIGGLGFMTIITMFSIMLKRRIGLRERSILQESVSTMQLGGVVRLIRKVIVGTFVFEGLGALLLSLRFIPKMGLKSGVFNSIFMSISAFCNAGFDLNGKYGEYSSLTEFNDDILVNIVIMLLILIGGIGFFVWDDIHKYKLNYKKYQLHTKIVLSITFWLTIIGSILFFAFEYNNTFKDMSLADAVTAAFFSSVTPRTAGFNSVDTAQLTPASKVLTIIYMFIGGSPGSTAGGAKTTTVAVLLISAWSTLRNSDECNIFNRRLENEAIRKAMSVITVNSILIILSTIIISFMQSGLDLVDVVFEIFSALDTVGMTTGVTRELSTVSRIVIMVLMYCGRVGSVSFALMFTENKKFISIKNPVEKINVG